MSKPSVHLSRMRERDAWDRVESLKEFLGEQLYRGRVALVLGAGASFGFGLPSWTELVDGVFANAGETRPEDTPDEVAAEWLLRKKLHGDSERLTSLVRTVLYADFDDSVGTLRQNHLLAAVGALVMASARGKVKHVISFNYDDVLERYLRYFGFTVESVPELPRWPSRMDVRVLHPHGLLPSVDTEPASKKIVFTKDQYDEVVGDAQDAWHSTMYNIFQSHTCLFVGLSGSDDNLMNILQRASKSHVSGENQHLFWGIRFGDDAKDPVLVRWEGKRVYPLTLDSYDHLPGWLFEVCQLAAERAAPSR